MKLKLLTKTEMPIFFLLPNPQITANTLINVLKMATVVGTHDYNIYENFMLSCVEQKKFYNLKASSLWWFRQSLVHLSWIASVNFGKGPYR